MGGYYSVTRFYNACDKGDIPTVKYYIPRMDEEGHVRRGFSFFTSREEWSVVVDLLPLCTYSSVTGEILNSLPFAYFKTAVDAIADSSLYIPYVRSDPEKMGYITEFGTIDILVNQVVVHNLDPALFEELPPVIFHT